MHMLFSGNYITDDFTSEGTIVNWLVSKVEPAEHPATCKEFLVNATNTVKDDFYLASKSECDWSPYIGNGWAKLPCCMGDGNPCPRHRYAIDLGQHAEQHCCRYCAKPDAQAYARVTLKADFAGEVTLRFVSNDGGVLWVNGERLLTIQTCQSASPGRLVSVTAILKKGDNDIVVKARNNHHLNENHGFMLRVDPEKTGQLWASIDL